MEVGIEECLHIEFEYDKSMYHLRDVVIGKVSVFSAANFNL
jgi:vacuolar protein sorting-associated protein 26